MGKQTAGEAISPEYEAFVQRKCKEFGRAARKYGITDDEIAMDVLAVLTPDDMELRISLRRVKGK